MLIRHGAAEQDAAERLGAVLTVHRLKVHFEPLEPAGPITVGACDAVGQDQDVLVLTGKASAASLAMRLSRASGQREDASPRLWLVAFDAKLQAAPAGWRNLQFRRLDDTALQVTAAELLYSRSRADAAAPRADGQVVADPPLPAVCLALLAMLMVAEGNGPAMDLQTLAQALGDLDVDLLKGVVRYLSSLDLARLGTEEQVDAVRATATAEATYGPQLIGFSPTDDARCIAELLSSDGRKRSADALAAELSLTPLRLNLAYRLLMERRAVDAVRVVGSQQYEFASLAPNYRTRVLARDWE